MSRTIPVAPFDYVVFGGSGDLALRKLLPSLFDRDREGQVPNDARIIAAARGAGTTESYRAKLHELLSVMLTKSGTASEAAPVISPSNQAALKRFLERLHYVQLDAGSDTGWPALKQLLSEQNQRIRVFYLSVGPELFAPIAGRIAAAGLINPEARIVLEKPIGTDLESSRAINTAIAQHFDESKIYRIDHYLGKETVQNLFALRFANSLFEPLWNRDHIDHVQISVAETVGLESRVAYYDKAGAFRDMVQNHLMQLVCLIAMEPPARYDADTIRDEKLKVLRALRTIQPGEWVRGQYAAGALEQKAVPGYADELGQASTTETFIALRLGIENWRWAGVPFYLRTGKRLPEKVSEVIIHFKATPHLSLPPDAGPIQSNRLIIRLQPNEGVQLALNLKEPGPGGFRIRSEELELSFAEAFGVAQPEAYERLLMDVVRGNQTLFMRRDEVDAAWRWATPALEGWKNEGPLAYAAGTWGPSAAHTLLARDGRSWFSGA
jgi:glucose-6-phosphate 1-dehydrogenase